jgi:hypothetical protein
VVNNEDRARRARELREQSEELLADDGGLLDAGELAALEAREERRAADAEWRRYKPPPAAKPKQEEILRRSVPTRPEPPNDTGAEWMARFEEMLSAERTTVAGTIAEFVFEELNRLRAEITKALDTKIAELRSEQRVAVAESKTEVLKQMTDILGGLRRDLFREPTVIDQPPPRSRAVN